MGDETFLVWEFTEGPNKGTRIAYNRITGQITVRCK